MTLPYHCYVDKTVDHGAIRNAITTSECMHRNQRTKSTTIYLIGFSEEHSTSHEFAYHASPMRLPDEAEHYSHWGSRSEHAAQLV